MLKSVHETAARYLRRWSCWMLTCGRGSNGSGRCYHRVIAPPGPTAAHRAGAAGCSHSPAPKAARLQAASDNGRGTTVKRQGEERGTAAKGGRPALEMAVRGRGPTVDVIADVQRGVAVVLGRHVAGRHVDLHPGGSVRCYCKRLLHPGPGQSNKDSPARAGAAGPGSAAASPTERAQNPR